MLNENARLTAVQAAGRMTANDGQGSLMEPRIKLWLEKDGGVALSGYRVRLLSHIAETGSLAEAARRMGLSYRRAWGKIKEMEANLGVRLVRQRGRRPRRRQDAPDPRGRAAGCPLPAVRGGRSKADVRRRFSEIFGEKA